MSMGKLDQAVLQILTLTHEGRLTWKHKAPPARAQLCGDVVSPLYFEAEYQGRKLALFERPRRFGGESKPGLFFVGAPADEGGESCHLGLLGDNGELLFEFPRSRQIRDLFETVRYKESNVGAFIDELLKSESAS